MLRSPPLIVVKAGIVLSIGILIALGFRAWRVRDSFQAGSVTPASGAVVDPAKPQPVAADLWRVFVGRPGTAESRDGHPLLKRFRLAGTFFVSAEGGDGEGNRRAILDDVGKSQQVLVGEGDKVDEVDVVRIHQDHVILRSGTEEVDLWLSFSGGVASSGRSDAGSATSGSSMEDEPALETSRFGKRIAENRWVMSRESVMKYYEEILEDPERIAALFVSMKPDYQDNKIKGYYLDPEGEEDFFKAVGMQPGDVVRKVNSMNMTSQKRAEYFIGEFVKNRANAIVIDIERQGKPEKLIYLVR